MAEAIPLLGGQNTVGMGLGNGNGLADLIKVLQPILLGSGATTGSGTQTSSTTPGINDLLTNLIGSITGANSGYTKDNAIADSSGMLNGMIKQLIDANMPSVLQGGANAGLYNDTTRGLLNNDLQARMAGQAAQALQQQIGQYASITNQNNQTAGNLAGILAGANHSTTNNTSQQTAPLVGRSGASNILTGLGGLAGTALLKNGGGLLSGLFGGSGTGGSSVGSGLSGVFSNTLGSGNAFGDSGMGLAGNMFTPNMSLPDVFGSSNIDMTSLLGNAGGSSGIFGTLGSLGSGITGGNISDSVGNIGSNISSGFDSNSLSGIGDMFNGAKNWLSDAGSSIGDFFGGLFANGGQVPKLPMKTNFADGGVVGSPDTMPAAYYANGGSVDSGSDKLDLTQLLASLMGRTGRPGGAAYNSDATGSRQFDISRALWQQLVGSGLQGGIGAGNFNVSDNGSITTMDQLIAALKNAQEQSGSQGTNGLSQALQGISSGRNLLNQGSTAYDVITGAAPGSAASIAGGIDGASSALAGAGDLGTVDAIGSMTGNAPFLPNAGVNSGGNGLFGGGAGMGSAAAGGALAGASLGGAGSVLVGGLGAGGLTPGLISGTMDGLLGGLGGTSAGAIGSGAGSVTGASGIFGGAAAGGGGAEGAGAAAGMGPAGLVTLPIALGMTLNSLFPGLTMGQQWQQYAGDFAKDPTQMFNKSSSLGSTLRGVGANLSSGGASDTDAYSYLKSFFDTSKPLDEASMKAGYAKGVQAIMQGAQGGADEGAAPYRLQVLKGLVDNPNLWSSLQDDSTTTAVNQAKNSVQGSTGGGNYEASTDQRNQAVNQALYNSLNSSGMLNNIYADPNSSFGQYLSNGGPNNSTAAANNGSNGGGNANGGMMPKQKDDPEGTADNMQINVSGGEYIVPKDVVDILGPKFFDGLVSQFHTPVGNRPPTKFGT